MIEGLLAVMTSSSFGAITGGLFGWLNRREDRKARAKDQDYELQRISSQNKADVSSSEARGFEASQVTTGSVSSAIKSAMRPVITGFLMYMMYGIYVQLEHLTGGIANFPAEESAEIYRTVVLNIICLTSTAVSWWFASRPTGILAGR